MRIQGEKKIREPLKIEEAIKRKTYSTLFLLPALNISKDQWDKVGFVNAYIGDDCGLQYKNALYILIEPEEFNYDYTAFMEEQANNPLFLEDYDVGTKQIMLVYRFPTDFEKEYKFFKKGKYSRFSKEYIKLFPMTKIEYRDGKKQVVSSVFAGIFNREEWLKEHWEKRLGTNIVPDEYWSIPQDEKEIFRYKQK